MWRIIDARQSLVRLVFAEVHRPFICPFSFGRLCRSTRAVEVTVRDGVHQLDSFELSNPNTLSAALKPVFRHLSRTSVVEYSGIEEQSLLFGLARNQRRVQLADLQAALTFLSADQHL